MERDERQHDFGIGRKTHGHIVSIHLRERLREEKTILTKKLVKLGPLVGGRVHAHIHGRGSLAGLTTEHHMALVLLVDEVAQIVCLGARTIASGAYRT